MRLPDGDATELDELVYNANRLVNFAMMWSATTLMMKPMDKTMTTKGSTLSPGDSSV